jgi:hypothetical protein
LSPINYISSCSRQEIYKEKCLVIIHSESQANNNHYQILVLSSVTIPEATGGRITLDIWLELEEV